MLTASITSSFTCPRYYQEEVHNLCSVLQCSFVLRLPCAAVQKDRFIWLTRAGKSLKLLFASTRRLRSRGVESSRITYVPTIETSRNPPQPWPIHPRRRSAATAGGLSPSWMASPEPQSMSVSKSMGLTGESRLRLPSRGSKPTGAGKRGPVGDTEDDPPPVFPSVDARPRTNGSPGLPGASVGCFTRYLCVSQKPVGQVPALLLLYQHDSCGYGMELSVLTS